MFRVTVGIWKYFDCMSTLSFYEDVVLNLFLLLYHVYHQQQLLVYCMYMVGYCSFQSAVYCNRVSRNFFDRITFCLCYYSAIGFMCFFCTGILVIT